jgi:hypothetical protein
VNLGAGNDQAVGGRGADSIDGGEGFDYARYDASAEGVNIDLAKGTATGGDATGDKLSNIEGLVGSQKNDVLTGDDKNNTIWANAGDDVVNTGAGNDWVEAQDGDDVVNLGSGDDQAVGGRGADVIDGGEGFDYARYDASTEGVNIDLAANTATGGDATGDKLSNIEGLVGSQKSDVLTGDDKNNAIWANAGDDVVSTGAGNDWIQGAAGNDTIDGGSGFDSANYFGATDNYEIVRNQDGSVTIKDLRTSGDGVDRLTNVETITLADGAFPVETLAKPFVPVILDSATAEPNQLTVRLGGEMGNGAGGRAEPPRYEVWANGEKISTGVVDWATIDRIAAQGAGGFHELKLEVAPGQQLNNVSVRFTNDAYEGKAETDRNMYVDAIEVNGKRFEAEGPAAKYHRGGDEIRGQEGMYWSGTMSFNTSDAPRPTDAHIAENVPGAVVGKISALGNSTEVTVSDDRFEVRDGNLKLKDGVSLNFEEASKIELELTGTNGTESWTRSVQIEVDGVNEANTAVNDSFNVSEDGTLSIEATQLLGNDTDLDADTLRIVGVSDAEHGTVTLLENGQIEFKADANYSGPAKFSYTVTDASGLTSTASVEIDVTAVADEASLVVENVSGLEDQAIALNLAVNLTDGDGSELLSVSIQGVPDGFTLSSGERQADGRWIIDPSELSNVTLSAPKDFNGQVNLILEATTAEEGSGESVLVSKTMTVTFADVKDNAVLSGRLTDYDIVSNEDGSFTVRDLRPGSPEGTQRVAGVESFIFADQTLAPDRVIEELLIANGLGSDNLSDPTQLAGEPDDTDDPQLLTDEIPVADSQTGVTSVEANIEQSLRDVAALANEYNSPLSAPVVEPFVPANDLQFVTLPPLPRYDWTNVKFSELVEIDANNGEILSVPTEELSMVYTAERETENMAVDEGDALASTSDESTLMSRLWGLMRAYGGLRPK